MARGWQPLWVMSVAVVVATIATTSLAAAARVGVELSDRDDSVVIEAIASIDAASDVAWRVLTDYARYTEFIPGVRASRVLRRDGAAVTVEQSTVAFVGPLPLPVTVVYEIAEAAPRDLWSSTEFPRLGPLYSHYVLRGHGPRSRLLYVGRLTPRSGTLPALERAVLTDTVTRQFHALAAEIERAAAADRSAAEDRR